MMITTVQKALMKMTQNSILMYVAKMMSGVVIPL